RQSSPSACYWRCRYLLRESWSSQNLSHGISRLDRRLHRHEREMLRKKEMAGSRKSLPLNNQTRRDWVTAAAMKDENSGCGSKMRDFSSGWNCTPTNHGWSGISTISGSTPSGDMPEKRRPHF